MRRTSLLALALALAPLSQVDLADAKCAMVAIVPQSFTAANATIDAAGGVVIGLDYGGREGGRSPSVEQKDWRFKQNGKLVEPTIKLIAPSLAVYEFTGASATLVDGKQKPVVSVRRGKAGPALAAPAVKAAAGKLDGGEMTRWGVSSWLTVELAGAAPAAAVGVIVYQAGKPVNWARLEAKATAVTWRAGGHCSNDLPGTLVPTSGDITIAWFDGSGRVSPQSAAIAIQPRKD